MFEEIKRRLRDEQRNRGEFARVYPCPASGADVPDEREARLVILRPERPHTAKTGNSPARTEAAAILNQRGSSPRIYRNTLAFLAADRTRLGELEQAVRQYLAWKSIDEERKILNLDAFQANQAQTKRAQSEETIKQRIPETYQWLLVPGQPDPQAPVEWEELHLQGQDPLAVRAAKKLKNDGLLLPQFAGTLLRHELDRIPLWRGDHVGLKQLAEDFAQYLYLPRLKDPEVLRAAVQDGLGLLIWKQDSFAYADGWDAEGHRYPGLRVGQMGNVILDGESLLVKPEVAAEQLKADEDARRRQTSTSYELISTDRENESEIANGDGSKSPEITVPKTTQPTRFHGAVDLDATRLGRDAGKIAEEIVQHFTGLLGTQVEVTLEIHAEIPQGAPDHVVRTVTENCRTLRFKTHGFEEA